MIHGWTQPNQLNPKRSDNTGSKPISVGAMNQRPRPTPGARVNKGAQKGGTALGDATNFMPTRADWENIPEHMPAPTTEGQR